MDHDTRKKTWTRRGAGAAAGAASLVLFLCCGVTPTQAVAAPQDAPIRAGDVVPHNAQGHWVPRNARTAPPRTLPSPSGRASRSSRVHAGALPRAQSAASFAHEHGMQWEDHQSHGVMHGGAMRIRVYANRRDAVVMGQQRTLRSAVTRNGGQMFLPACVSAYLAREVATARYKQHQARERQMHLAAAAARQRTPVAPRPVARKPVAPAPKPQSKPVAKPTPPPVRPVASSDSHPDAGWQPRGVTERKWKWIILHHSDDTSGNAAKYDRIHREDNGWEHGLGYHFVIGNGTESRDGQVEIGPRWQRQLHGAHAKTPDNRFNDYGVGICLVGDFETGSGRPTAAQMDNLVRLVRWLQARYGISNADVQGHCHCCPTACPGRHFPWDELRRRIR